jgi:3-hydroxyacyl-[acyl-carrier-protein] dehydratase
MPAANNDLLRIDAITHEDGVISATISINPNSEILKGHFPGQPIVPGACMLQIIKEVLEGALNTSIRLKKADHLKFLSMIDPENTRSVLLEVSYKFAGENTINVTGKLVNGETVGFKFQGSFMITYPI